MISALVSGISRQIPGVKTVKKDLTVKEKAYGIKTWDFHTFS
jgi:hypothetical protein